MYLELDHLKKHFDGREVVRDLSLTLEQGQLLCILGASGCGKTTTLNMIGGFLEPDSGRVRLDGEDITRIPPEQRPVTTVFQSYGLFPHMTVLQNVIYGLKFRGVKREQARQKGMRYLDMVGLADYASAYIQEISGGQQQRVALARILAYEPEVLLLDEPFSAMDTYLREGLRLELAGVLKDYDGVSILVTHDRDEAYQLCDSLLLLDRGRVLAGGKTRDIFQCPVTCQAARLTGCKNISRIERLGARRIKALDWGGLELSTDRDVDGSITAVGIRAHDFEPLSDGEAGQWKGRENANLIQVESPNISEMPFEWYITLSNGLWWKKEKDIHTHNTAGLVPGWLRVEPSALLLLTGELNG